jgi:alpha-L-fucosidase 2
VTPSVNDWIGQLQNVVKKADAIPLAVAKKQHQQWWADRWSRSWVDIHTHESPKGQLVSRAYVLQRWMDISTGRGAMPIKFNGLVYITHPDWPDYREWGGGYWWQNTRLPYWSMPTAGDTDLMKPLFKMYADVMPMALARTKLYFNHGGIYFPETMYFWGTYEPVDYGCSRGNPPLARWITENTWIRYHITGGLEVIAMMFDYYWHTGDDQFGREVLVPFCAHTLTFYESHYGPDLAGKIILTPAQSLETYQDVINPTTDLAGLISMTENVMKLPDSLAGPLKSKFQQFSSTIPPIPLSNTTNLIGKCKNGKNNGIYCSDSKKPFSSQNSKSFGRKNKQQVEQHDLAVESKKDEAVPYILPAYAFLRSEVHNSENVELYTVFPYNIYGLLKPGLDIAKKTYSQRPFPCNDGWCQDVVQAALLGLYKDAQSQMIGRMLAPPAPGVRFPSFWGPDQDGTPDEDHGAVGKIALQWMLLHADGDQIILFGGWPGDWDVSFQLHAPYNTTVIGSCRAGVLTFLDVNPPSRYKDLVFPGPYCTP